MRLIVLSDESVLAIGRTVAPILLTQRVLRPLHWFSLLQYRHARYLFAPRLCSKSVLFDRFVGFHAGVVRTEGTLH